ncbi:MAG: outer membrane protein, partial [Methyloceanibacter sp.]
PAMLATVGFGCAMLLAPDLAKATDLTPISPAPPPVVTELPPTWQGFYFGGNLGAAFDANDLSIKDLSADQDLSLRFSNGTEFIGGVHGGYNWQSGGLLLGVEGDIAFADNIDYLASVRGRAGWATPNWLFYGTAGVAFIDTNTSFAVTSPGDGRFGFSVGNTDTGFVGGGGIEYKLAENLSLGVEGLYYNFGSDTRNLVTGANEPFVLKDDLDFAVVRGRLTYHFNGF